MGARLRVFLTREQDQTLLNLRSLEVAQIEWDFQQINYPILPVGKNVKLKLMGKQVLSKDFSPRFLSTEVLTTNSSYLMRHTTW